MIEKLKKGDTIGIINPAFKNPDNVFERYSKMIEGFEEKGFTLKFGKTFTATEGYLAGSDELRAEDVNEMFKDPEVKAIVCMRGGYGCSRMVDKVDFEVIKNNPKLLCGFSDITVLTNAIYKKTNIPALHGLVGIYVGSNSCDEFSINDFWTVLTENQKGRVLQNPNKDAKVMVPGKCTGEIIGGNLSLIATMVGSEYELDFTDKIVFIEEVSEEPYQIDRYLSSIKLRGMLEKAKGFVLGYFTGCNQSEGRKGTQTVMDVLEHYLKDLGKPVLYDFACGHDFPFVNLPIGIKATLDTDTKTITLEEDLYEAD